MSTLLKHLSKLCRSTTPKDVIKNQNVSLSQTPPYLMMGVWDKKDGLVEMDLYNPIKEETTTISDKTHPGELMEWDMVGLSHGWGIFMDELDNSVVRISDFCLPSASKSSPEITLLPPLNRSLTTFEPVHNVSMSSPPDQEEEDCVVAIKFKGFQLSLCVLGRDSEWTNIITPFNYFHDSTLSYSKRDQSFYMFPMGRQFLASWYIHSKIWDHPKFHELRFHDIPKLPQSEWEALESCAKTEYLVEAPSGESFYVKCYGESFPCVFHGKESIHYKTKRMMVFRHEESRSKDGGRSMWYTEDIGDLCIFLAMNEPFCVQASSCPGLKPNSIYHMNYGFGVYDLATKTDHTFNHNNSVFACPCWIPPTFL